MTNYVNEYLDRKMTLAEARQHYEEQLSELKTYAAIFYMKERGYTYQEGKWVKKD